MAIYLDANILIPWNPLAHLERVAMSIAAQRLGQAIVIPKMAVDEAEAHLVRRLKSAEHDLVRSQKAFNELFDAPALVETPPDLGDLVSDWSHSLLELFTIRTHPQGAAEDALRREVLRLPPARATYDSQGKDHGATGARDALIWLTILDDIRSRDEDGHLVTANKDFVRSDRLRPELEAEVPPTRTLAGYASAFRFLELLGEHQPRAGITLDEFARRATPSVLQLLPLTLALPKAIFGVTSVDWDYEIRLSQAAPTRIKGTRRWAAGDEGLTVVDSEWALVATAVRSPRFREGASESEEDVELHGTIQLYLPDSGGKENLAQIVSGRFAREPEW
jgi:hypothetical protein